MTQEELLHQQKLAQVRERLKNDPRSVQILGTLKNLPPEAMVGVQAMIKAVGMNMGIPEAQMNDVAVVLANEISSVANNEFAKNPQPTSWTPDKVEPVPEGGQPDPILQPEHVAVDVNKAEPQVGLDAHNPFPQLVGRYPKHIVEGLLANNVAMAEVADINVVSYLLVELSIAKSIAMHLAKHIPSYAGFDDDMLNNIIEKLSLQSREQIIQNDFEAGDVKTFETKSI